MASSKDWLEAREKMTGAPCVPRRVESLDLKLRSKSGEISSGDGWKLLMVQTQQSSLQKSCSSWLRGLMGLMWKRTNLF